MVLVIIVIWTVMFIMIDEVIMAVGQRRIGPQNVGWYGNLAAIMNGINLMISQAVITAWQIISQMSYVMLCLGFMSVTVMNLMMMYPFMIVEVGFSYLIVVINLFISLGLLMIIGTISLTKYSILGAIRLISQYIGSELVLTSLFIIIIWANNQISIGRLITSINSFQSILGLIFIISSLICILAESNRVPFDIAEAESELVAGFLTEQSSIYFSLLLFTEYAGIIVLVFLLIISFHLVPLIIIGIMNLISLIRTSLARLKYDEMMMMFWIYLLPVIFSLIILSLSISNNGLINKGNNNVYEEFKMVWGKIMNENPGQAIKKETAQMLVTKYPKYVKYYSKEAAKEWISNKELDAGEQEISVMIDGIKANLLTPGTYLKIIRYLLYRHVKSGLMKKHGYKVIKAKQSGPKLEEISVRSNDRWVKGIIRLIMAGISASAKMKLESYEYVAFKSWEVRMKVMKNGKLAGKSEIMKVNMMLDTIYLNKGLMIRIIRYGHRLLTVGSMIRDSAQEHDVSKFISAWGKIFASTKMSYRSSILRLVVSKDISIGSIIRMVSGNVEAIRKWLIRKRMVVPYMVSLLKKEDGSFRPLQVPHPVIWMYSLMVYRMHMSKYIDRISGKLSNGIEFIDYGCQGGFTISGLISHISSTTITTDIRKAYDNINLSEAIIKWGKLSSGDNKHLISYGEYLLSVWPTKALVQGSQLSAALCTNWVREIISGLSATNITVIGWIDNLIVTGSESNKAITEIGNIIRLKEILPVISSQYSNLRILGIWISFQNGSMQVMTSRNMWNEWLRKDSRNNEWEIGNRSNEISWQSSSSGKTGKNEILYDLNRKNKQIT